jgi:O-antigen/teichoic acid export membrane protein/aminoglycoside phosphotransferase
MSPTATRILALPSIARLHSHLRAPLYRNGYALVLSSVVTSGLGVLYWIIAARLYPAEVVGLNSAILAAITLLANISQLNLMNALNRFIPSAGRATSRLIIVAYLISITVALLASLIYIGGIDVWSPTLGRLKSNPWLSWWFIIATMGWCIFVLQDSALTGLRQAGWVPLENTIFALAKILLLVALASSLSEFGIIASWIIPLLLLLFPTNWLIFRYLLPWHLRSSVNQVEPVVPGQIARYVAGDYLSSLVWMATTNILPLLVVERAGVEANAYFFLAWTIAYSLYLVSRNMGQSLIAEAAAQPAQLMVYTYRTFLQTTRLLVPLVALLLIAAPYILWLFGPDYAAQGATLLRLLCLAALPNIVTNLYISLARVQRRMKVIVLVLSTVSLLVLGLSYVWLDRMGITGVGWAWLLSQTAIALILLLTELRFFWLVRLNVQPLLDVLAQPRRLWQRRHNRQHLATVQLFMSEVLPQLATEPLAASWSAQALIETVNDMTVASLGPADQPAQAIIKLPRSQAAAKSLERHRAALAALWAEPALAGWVKLLPAILAEGQPAGQPFLIERMLPGVEARRVFSQASSRQQIQRAALAAINTLHRATATTAVVDEVLLARWVDEPLRLVRQLGPIRRQQQSYDLIIERLTATLGQELAGRSVALSWVHGDFVPGNILVSPDGARLTGIVDWELASPADLPQLDLVLFFIASRLLIRRRELGDIVTEFLAGPGWTPSELVVLAESQAQLPGEPVAPRTLILLAWLRHLAANLTKAERYANHPLWVAKNVEVVLQYLHIIDNP